MWERARTVREGLGQAQLLGHPHARGGEGGQIDPGLDAETVEHPHQVLGGEVAGGALRVRTAAEAARGGVDRGHAVLERREGVGEGLAVGVVEVHADPLGGDAFRVQRGQQRPDVARGGDADGVAEAELVAAEVEQRLGGADDLGERDRSLPGVAEAHGQVAAYVGPVFLGAGHDGLEHGEGLGDGAVEVAGGEGLGGRTEDGDAGGAQGQRPVETALVGDEDGQGRVDVGEEGEQLLRVGQLGHPLGVDEAGGLDGGQPGSGQAADELGLDGGRDGRLLVLQPVTGADLVDADAGRQLGNRDGHGQSVHDVSSFSSSSGVTTARTWSMATVVPGETSSSVTVPEWGAEMTCSIFIASTTSRL